MSGPVPYIRIEWEGGYVEIKYSTLVSMSIKRRRKVVALAAKCGGWRLIYKEEKQ